LTLAPAGVARFVRPAVSARVAARLYLFVLVGLSLAVVGMLVFLSLFLAPHTVMDALGTGCAHTAYCLHGLPLWAQWCVWLPVVALLGWVLLAAGQSAVSRVRAGRRMRRLVTASGRPTGTRRGIPVYEVDGPEVLAFTAGLVRPFIVVSAGLVGSLSREEYEVVLTHEDGHASGRDNVALFVARVLSRALAFVPGVRAAGRGLCSALEIAADDYAGRHTGDRLLVASSVTRVARLTEASPAGSRMPHVFASFEREGLVVERVRHLMRGERPTSRARLLSTAVALGVAVSVLFAGMYVSTGSDLAFRGAASTCTTTMEK
jgi:Zn-dependent protease with chaperone function